MVGTEGRERDDAAHGRDLDDVTRALLAEDREDRLRDMENAEQVRLELVAQLLLGDLLDRSEEPVARVVDDDVDPPERLVRGLHRSEHLVAVGDVELNREDGVAVLLDQVTQSVRVAGGRCDLVATLEGGEDELAAKAFRRASDEPNFAHDAPCAHRRHLTPSRHYMTLSSPRVNLAAKGQVCTIGKLAAVAIRQHDQGRLSRWRLMGDAVPSRRPRRGSVWVGWRPLPGRVDRRTAVPGW